MFKDAIARIHGAKSFLITGHIHPDGDCVGSIFAVQKLLMQLDKIVTVVCHDPIPRNLAFLNLSWLSLSDLDSDFSCDCVIALDTPSLKRLGSVGDFLASHKNILVIDHHVSNSLFGAVNVVDPAASSCGEMVYKLFTEIGVPISSQAAELLYVAISTDTGSFRYSNTSQSTHLVIAHLIACGIDLCFLNDTLYSRTSRARFQLMQQFFARASFSHNKKIAWSFLTGKDLIECNGVSDDLEGFVNFLRDIEDVVIAFFAFQQDSESPTKISFRAKGSADVNILAACFNGGGHPKAAGCTAQKSIENIVPDIIAKAAEQLHEGEK
jgi:phosphoesterase RecJ-like protein